MRQIKYVMSRGADWRHATQAFSQGPGHSRRIPGPTSFFPDVALPAACRVGDLLEREFRRTVDVEETICFLIRVGELRVAKPREHLHAPDGVEQGGVVARQ